MLVHRSQILFLEFGDVFLLRSFLFSSYVYWLSNESSLSRFGSSISSRNLGQHTVLDTDCFIHSYFWEDLVHSGPKFSVIQQLPTSEGLLYIRYSPSACTPDLKKRCRGRERQKRQGTWRKSNQQEPKDSAQSSRRILGNFGGCI